MSSSNHVAKAVQSEEEIQRELVKKADRKSKLTMVLPYAGLVLLVAFFTIATGGKFVGGENIVLLLNQCFNMVVVIVGGAFLYAIGGLDMAIGSVMGVSAMIMTLLFSNGVPLLFSFLVGLAASIACMSVTACAKNYLKVDPFVASMCVMNVCQGIVTTVIAKKGTLTFPFSKAPWLDASVTKVITLVLLIATGYVLFNKTAFGKSLKAIGGNPKVAKISGIKVERTVLLAYVAIAFTLTLGALFATVRAGVVDSGIGAGLNLNVMTAIVLGGFPLTGGANARFSAPIVGALTVTVLSNGLGMLGLANTLGYAIKGLMFLIVVAISYEKSKGKLIS